MIKNIFLILCTGFYLTAAAQTDTFHTDRPWETISPYTVPKGNFQAEFGFEKHNFNFNNYSVHVPAALLKFGLGRIWELRLQTAYRNDYYERAPNPLEIEGFEPLQIGTKISLGEEKGWIPKTAFIAQIGLSEVASDEFKPREPIASLLFAMEHNLSRTTDLGYNMGLKWQGYSSSPVFAYTFAPQFDLSPRFRFFIESYGYIGKENFHDHNLATGIAFLVSKNIKLDLSGGAGLSAASEKSFVGLGFSFRVPVSKRN